MWEYKANLQQTILKVGQIAREQVIPNRNFHIFISVSIHAISPIVNVFFLNQGKTATLH